MEALCRNPLVWLLRFRHRCGYGVHSPFAFNFITDVLYQRGEYYAYSLLARSYGYWYRLFDLLPLQRSRLLFRLVNYVHPRRMLLLGASGVDAQYMSTACPSAIIEDKYVGEKADFVYLAHPADDVLESACHSGTMLVLDHLPRHRRWWRELQARETTGVTFDLYYLGIAFFDRKMYKQHYIVNW